MQCTLARMKCSRSGCSSQSTCNWGSKLAHACCSAQARHTALFRNSRSHCTVFRCLARTACHLRQAVPRSWRSHGLLHCWACPLGILWQARVCRCLGLCNEVLDVVLLLEDAAYAIDSGGHVAKQGYHGLEDALIYIIPVTIDIPTEVQDVLQRTTASQQAQGSHCPTGQKGNAPALLMTRCWMPESKGSMTNVSIPNDHTVCQRSKRVSTWQQLLTGTYCGMYMLIFSLLMPLKMPE